MKKLLPILLCLLVLLPVCGCGPILGLFADALPKDDVPAEFDTAGSRVAVFVSSTGNTEIGPVFKRELTNRMNFELITNNAAISAIDYSEIGDLKLKNSNVVTAETVGRHFDIDMIIKIEVEQFSIDYRSSQEMTPGQMLCFVSVARASDGKRLWPTEELYKPFSIKTSLDHDSQVKFTSSLIQRNLADQAANEMAKLFYLHKP